MNVEKSVAISANPDLSHVSAFWQAALEGFTVSTPLGVDHMPLEKSFVEGEYQTQAIALDQAQTTAWKNFTSNGIELFTLFQGAWAILLSRYSGETDVVFGVQTTTTSSEAESRQLLPLRVQVPPDASAYSWLQKLQIQWATLQAYRLVTLTQVQAWSDIPATMPLFESLLVVETAGNFDQAVSYPITITLQITSEWTLEVRYDRHRFHDDTITRLIGHLQTLIEGIVANPDQRLADLPLLTTAEHRQLLVKWNQTQTDYPKSKTIHQLFEEQVTRTPDAIAVMLPSLTSGNTTQLTYQELNDRANALACHLQMLGVKTETFVAMCMERSLETIVAILGILKVGGVYVPLDPAYPQERLAFMLEDTQAPVLLTQSHLRDRLPPHRAEIVCLDVNWGAEMPVNAALTAAIVTADNLAYINYTSGSTGRPKGVAIPHRAVLRLVFGANYTPLNGSQTLLQLAPISFDAATFEIWGALLHGGRCVLYPGSGVPDPKDLGLVIRKNSVSTLFLTTALFNTMIAESPEVFSGVRELLTGGEAISMLHIRQALAALPDMQLIHVYGPTESTTFSCFYKIPHQIDATLTTLPIGKPIANTQTYILDAELKPVPVGVIGELYIGGDGLAREYLNLPKITTERFIPHPFGSGSAARLYKTGDHVRYLPDGNIEFIGRKDNQVKIRGYRIELGEIEQALEQHESVGEAVVLMYEDIPGNKRLVAYVTPRSAHSPSIEQLKTHLQQRLAAYMIPAVIMVLDKIPLTPNGKADRGALPQPASNTSTNFVAANTSIERALADIWCAILGLERVGVEDNFFDLGGTSILSLQLIARIQKQFQSELRTVKLYQYPTIRMLAQYLGQEKRQPQVSRSHSSRQPAIGVSSTTSTELEGIAIIGMVGRFPGADSVEELWHNLCEGIESTTFFSEAELDPSVAADLRSDPSYVLARGIVKGAETFDATFFGISPREAEVMDPQARVFLELAYEALENAGYGSESNAGVIGLYAGSGQNTYFEKHLCGRSDIIGRLGEFQTMLANEKDFVTTRTSYKLGLTGPSLSINTACSTSLVAVIQAFQGLLNHQCDLALAGGISITTPQNRGYLYQEGSMLSPDGRCRPFDAHAQGTMFNSGAGIVVLKRLADALDDGDRIYAVVRGVGINNDGTDKVSFTAPSVNGQAAAIAMAQASAGFHPETISYVETHGTATPLGDPIEVEALTQAFRDQTDATQFCAIGSLKSNVGHLVAAAGVTGLIKTALALYHKKIPPSLNFEAPNPEIDFANSPFYVNTKLVEWAAEAPRRAGVSSFGVGGTNAHIVLEEAPTVTQSSPSRPCQLLLLSAKTSTALDQATERLHDFLQQQPQTNLADVAYTLQQGRRAYNHRRFVVSGNSAEAIATLKSLDPTRTATRQTELRNPEVVFMFPGQGSQYLNMGLNLYQREPVFQVAVDRCAEILQPLLGRDLREVMYAADGNDETAAAALRQTQFTQPALFTIEYALAQLWQSWGIQPAALMGHSIGEFVAACLAGVFSLEDGLKLVATRGQMMGALPGGSMLSVRLPAAAVSERLAGNLANTSRLACAIAAINGPSLCVVSGPTDAVAQLQAELEAEEVACRLLHTSHAFHSPMMDSIIEPFAALVQTIPLAAPKIPFVSTATADWITDAQATDPLYWASHLRATVRFAEGVQTLWQQPERVLLEVGPRTTAATLARQQAKDLKQQIAISSLGSTAADETEWTTLLQAIGQLWLAGVAIDWQSFYSDEYRQRLPLPTYPFERQRYWIDPEPAASPPIKMTIAVAAPPSTQATSATQPCLAEPPIPPSPISAPAMTTSMMSESRKKRLLPQLKEVLETTSGLDIASTDERVTFLEMGLDSLALTQVALALKKKFKVKITFRHLLEDYPNLDTLSNFMDQSLPPDALPAPAPVANDFVARSAIAVDTSAPPSTPTTTAMPPLPYESANGANGNGSNGNGATPPGANSELAGTVQAVVAQQLQIMAQQLQLLGQTGSAVVSTVSLPTIPATKTATPLETALPATAEPKPSKAFGPGAKIEKSVDTTLTPAQRSALDRLIARYVARTQESKRQTQEHRQYLADPRTVSGFTPLLKEMVYPIVTDRAAGSKLWDVDGNEYVDLTNGFGLNFFGWSPDFVTDAVKAQLDKGIEIGPQSPLAGRVAKLITEFTRMERVAFCNTGSEAVMAALRLARTVTGRSTVVIFAGGYHGTFDEVIVKGTPKLKSLPAAPGLMASMFENILVLDYGTPESLEIIRERADDLAAVMVEPVQSRRPELQPKEFLHELRKVTEQSGTALIFDEVVTGFRVHPGGAQAYFGINADLATYGKVVGGGIPIGVLAGKAEYMDALDGGHWQFGDDSFPEVGVTFFAGTFVRHPMALAAAEAVLTRLQQLGEDAQRSLAAKADKFVTHLNQYFQQIQAPIQINHFSSFFYVTYSHEIPYGGLLFYLLREKGVHIWDHRPCFFTLAHSDADIEFITQAFKDSVAEMQAVGFLPKLTGATSNGNRVGMIDRNQPPQPGARLGKDPQGNPAWFIPDTQRPGKYLQLGGVT